VQPISHIAKCGRWTVEFFFQNGSIDAKWSPSVPKKGEISKIEFAVYESARNVAYQKFADDNGYILTLIDTPAGTVAAFSDSNAKGQGIK
jgi:hypothetical protein